MELEQAIDIMNQMKNSYDKTVSRNIGDESFLNQINAISKAIELILANIEPDCKHKNAYDTQASRKNAKDNQFSVWTYETITEKSKGYVNWSEDLKMTIIKNGVSISLKSKEVEQVVRSLPRTLGGTY